MRGGNARILYQTTGTHAAWPEAGPPANLVEIDEIGDTSYTLRRARSERRNRSSAYAGVHLGSYDVIEISFSYEPQAQANGDTVFVALENSLENETLLSIAYTDGDEDTDDTHGIWAEFVVTELSRTDPYDAESTVSVVLALSASRTEDPEFVDAVATPEE